MSETEFPHNRAKDKEDVEIVHKAMFIQKDIIEGAFPEAKIPLTKKPLIKTTEPQKTPQFDTGHQFPPIGQFLLRHKTGPSFSTNN